MARATDIDRMKGTMTFHMNIILGADGSARMTRTPAQLARDERSLALSITVPTKIFQTPTLRASIEIPSVEATPAINIEAAHAALREALGIDIDIAIHHPEGE